MKTSNPPNKAGKRRFLIYKRGGCMGVKYEKIIPGIRRLSQAERGVRQLFQLETGTIFDREAVAKEMLRLMGWLGTRKNIYPCSECSYLKETGCTKVSYVSRSEKKEVGPIYDIAKNAVVCPIEGSIIYVDGVKPKEETETTIKPDDQSIIGARFSKSERTQSKKERKAMKNRAALRISGIPKIEL